MNQALSGACARQLQSNLKGRAGVGYRSLGAPSRLCGCTQIRGGATLAEPSDNKKYSHTLKLPRTEFPLRANAAHREKQFRPRCTDQLYEWQLKNNPGSLFVLHDGPPYANGDLHVGHFMNKVLKDIVNRYQVMNGRRVLYFPGWDCHGLPIEQKALDLLKNRDRDSLDPMEIRSLARKFALKAVDKQKKSFREWGVMGDWEHPYLTLHPEYEANQLGIFKAMFEKGYIYRQNRPVYWSPSSRTALAEAELEYRDDHVSTSVYVKLPLAESSARSLGVEGAARVAALVWTTTPWTLPANSAITVNPDLEYALIQLVDSTGSASAAEYMLVGKERQSAIAEHLPSGTSIKTARVMRGKELEGLEYSSILRAKTCRIVLADYVTESSGTGLVHSAPGHGKEDYEVGLANGIDVFSPVDDFGRFTAEAGPELEGMEVLGDGSKKVIELLESSGALLRKETFTHSYPYDWRTKKPIIQRATPQWFANVHNLQKSAWKSVEDVKIVPESGRRRLNAFVMGRSEWCISRQRSWGVPIPVLYNKRTGDPLITTESISHIIEVIRKNGGSNAWWTLPIEEFLLPEFREDGEAYVRGSDTMDVWFDSGSSWKLIEDRGVVRDGPYADVYLEGSDQHRGWFQSSLLTSNAVRGVSPYKTLITHGFTLDEKGRKMSKSIGNTLSPSQVISGGKDKKKEPAYGVDLLRLLVGSTDYTQDVSFGPTIFTNFSDTMRKIRTTTRFMLGNLAEFTPADAVEYSSLEPIDRYALHELYHFKQKAKAAFDNYEFFRSMQLLNYYTNASLSAFYFDVTKDRLYADAQKSDSRRSVQTVLYHILVNYTTTLAPLTCHLAEEIWEFFGAVRNDSNSGKFSIFQEKWDQTSETWNDPKLASEWQALKQVRNIANRAIDMARQKKVIGSSLEAELDIYLPLNTSLGSLLKSYNDSLSQICITSRAEVHSHEQLSAESSLEKSPNSLQFSIEDDISFGGNNRVTVVCRRSALHKCPRCWNFHSMEEDALCKRCDGVVNKPLR